VDPHKQTLIDLQYFIEKLNATGHEVLILMDANQAEEQTCQSSRGTNLSATISQHKTCDEEGVSR
jgi:hypothetical protein